MGALLGSAGIMWEDVLHPRVPDAHAVKSSVLRKLRVTASPLLSEDSWVLSKQM